MKVCKECGNDSVMRSSGRCANCLGEMVSVGKKREEFKGSIVLMDVYATLLFCEELWYAKDSEELTRRVREFTGHEYKVIQVDRVRRKVCNTLGLLDHLGYDRDKKNENC